MSIEILVLGYLSTNCYILKKDDMCLVIDPADSFFEIQKAIGESQLKGILLTHMHPDHIGAMDELVRFYQVPVFKKDNLVEGQVNMDSFVFSAIFFPGHTSDSVAYYFKDDKAMFTGDFLFYNNVGRTDLETGDYLSMLSSIEKVKQYPDDITIYPGHGELSKLGYEKKNNPYF